MPRTQPREAVLPYRRLVDPWTPPSRHGQPRRRDLRAAVRGGPRRRLHRRWSTRAAARRSSANPLPQADVRLRRRHAGRRGAAVRDRALRRSAGARAVSSSGCERDGAVTDYLLRLRRADRAPMWVEVTAHAEDADGSALRVEALMRDVSERKRLEDQARDLYHQLLQAEKLAALGQTISGVAHELNNPLATILTWAERLSQRAGGRADATRPRHHPRRVGARREDRPQPPDLRAQAPHHARDGRPQPGRARDAGAALLRAAAEQHHHPRGARRRPAAACSPIRTRSSRCCST